MTSNVIKVHFESSAVEIAVNRRIFLFNVKLIDDFLRRASVLRSEWCDANGDLDMATLVDDNLDAIIENGIAQNRVEAAARIGAQIGRAHV